MSTTSHEEYGYVHHSAGNPDGQRSGEVMTVFSEGDRVALHPATDQFMRGQRYGTVIHVYRTGNIRVLPDRGAGFDIKPDLLNLVRSDKAQS